MRRRTPSLLTRSCYGNYSTLSAEVIWNRYWWIYTAVPLNSLNPKGCTRKRRAPVIEHQYQMSWRWEQAGISSHNDSAPDPESGSSQLKSLLGRQSLNRILSYTQIMEAFWESCQEDVLGNRNRNFQKHCLGTDPWKYLTANLDKRLRHLEGHPQMLVPMQKKKGKKRKWLIVTWLGLQFIRKLTFGHYMWFPHYRCGRVPVHLAP